MLIDFVTSRQSAGAEISYPLIKWRHALSEAGIDIKISHIFPNKNSPKADAILLTQPYYRDRFKTNGEYDDARDEILERDFAKARNLAPRLIFFDTADSTASKYLHLLDKVDLMLKWQVLSDKSYYCTNQFEQQPLLWQDDAEPALHRQRADPKEIWKLKIGWNLGYRNYSIFRKGARHLHWRGITWDPRFTSVDVPRPLLTFWRGASHGRARASHRQKAIDVLNSMRHPDILVGPGVSRRLYLRDIKKSKVVVSPFGYGEPCYRDMEAFICGSILVKPSMQHLETFPDVYKPNETYVPVRWDFADLEDTLRDIEHNYDQYRTIAQTGQSLYRRLLEDPSHFVNHWKSILGHVFDETSA